MAKIKPLDPNQLISGVVTDPEDPALGKIYNGAYKKSFPDKNEREPLKNLKEYVEGGQEIWVYERDPQSNKIVGASNIVILEGVKGEGIDGTVQGNYTFVDPAHREQGVLKRLLTDREPHAEEFARGLAEKEGRTLPEKPNLLYFSEQESPLLMTPTEFLAAMESGIDPISRRNAMEHQGLQEVDIRYIQPRLTADGDPVKTLSLCVRGAKDNLSTSLTQDHLNALFAASYPEGTSLANDRDLKPIKDSLARAGETVAVLPPGRFEGLAGQLLQEAGKAVPEDKKEQILALKDMLEAIPKAKQGQPLGELFPETAMEFFKGTNLQNIQDLLPTTSAAGVISTGEEQGSNYSVTVRKSSAAAVAGILTKLNPRQEGPLSEEALNQVHIAAALDHIAGGGTPEMNPDAVTVGSRGITIKNGGTRSR